MLNPLPEIVSASLCGLIFHFIAKWWLKRTEAPSLITFILMPLKGYSRWGDDQRSALLDRFRAWTLRQALQYSSRWVTANTFEGVEDLIRFPKDLLQQSTPALWWGVAELQQHLASGRIGRAVRLWPFGWTRVARIEMKRNVMLGQEDIF